jgi:hypothetical protein
MFEGWRLRCKRAVEAARRVYGREDRESGKGTLRMHAARTALRYSSGFLNFYILDA